MNFITKSLRWTSEGPKATAEVVQPLTVEAIDNHVYFYSGVNADRCLAVIRTLRELDARLRTEQVSRQVEYATPIWLHIQSEGGDLFAGLGLADQIKTITSPVYSVIEGFAASAATLFSVVCDKRYITPNSFMLIHQFSSVFWGTYEQFKDETKLQEMAMARFIDIYGNHSNVSKKELTERLKHDFWMSAADAVKDGFVDEVLG